jgi:hypothetical protein
MSTYKLVTIWVEFSILVGSMVCTIPRPGILMRFTVCVPEV